MRRKREAGEFYRIKLESFIFLHVTRTCRNEAYLLVVDGDNRGAEVFHLCSLRSKELKGYLEKPLSWRGGLLYVNPGEAQSCLRCLFPGLGT